MNEIIKIIEKYTNESDNELIEEYTKELIKITEKYPKESWDFYLLTNPNLIFIIRNCQRACKKWNKSYVLACNYIHDVSEHWTWTPKSC